MQPNDPRSRISGNGATYRAPGFIAKALTFATGAVLLVIGVMFSLVVLAVAAIVASGILGYLWWKTRDLRQRLRENPPGGRVIEGEAIHDDERR
jgi:O-antigen/teichoic acid export membrane protein